jgi:hypothetical protein
VKNILDQLRKELEECIDRFGFLDPKTIAKSQELDIEIVRVMNKGE